MKRRPATIIATLTLYGAGPAVAAEPPPDAEFLEFLGSVEAEDEAFENYLLSHGLPAHGQRTTTEARPAAASNDDPDASE